MIYTQSRHGIDAKEKEHLNSHQENASANDSLISLLALATVSMVGLTLAVHCGTFTVSSAGKIGCYVGTGIAGLALSTAIASRCIGGSKPAEKPKSDSGRPRVPARQSVTYYPEWWSGQLSCLLPSRYELTCDTQVTFYRIGKGTSSEQKWVYDVGVGDPWQDFDYEDRYSNGAYSLVYYKCSNHLFHIFFENDEVNIVRIENSPQLEHLFATGKTSYIVPKRKDAATIYSASTGKL